jgi:hypothetical protein
MPVASCKLLEKCISSSKEQKDQKFHFFIGRKISRKLSELKIFVGWFMILPPLFF